MRKTKATRIEPILWPAEVFKRWQRNHNLTGAAVARIFQVRPHTVCKWRKEGIPAIVMWACLGYTDGRWRPKNIKDLINPPMRENDLRRGNVPPHLKEAAEAPRGPQNAPRKPYRPPSMPAPEWPIDPVYDD